MPGTSDAASIKILVKGLVQGVNFRVFTRRMADGLNLTGYVRNLPGGDSVEVYAEGNSQNLEKMLELLRKGPPGARVDSLDYAWQQDKQHFTRFEIRY